MILAVARPLQQTGHYFPPAPPLETASCSSHRLRSIRTIPAILLVAYDMQQLISTTSKVYSASIAVVLQLLD
jgi:hypothetical protein